MIEHAADLDVGRFLDIGAGDGTTFSNTRALAMGRWGGVVVEPAAWAFDKLVALYVDRDDVLPVQAVVTGATSGLCRFSYSKDDHLSSVDPVHIATWRGKVPFLDVLAAAIPLGELLDYMPPFSIVSIDAEGLTGELLQAYQRHPAWEDVQLICYEHVAPKMHSGRTVLAPPWQLVAETPNNLIYRRAA